MGSYLHGSKPGRACIGCAQRTLRMHTPGREVFRTNCDICNWWGLTVAAEIPDRLRYKEPAPPAPRPGPAEVAFAAWTVEAKAVRDGEATSPDLAREAFLAGFAAGEKQGGRVERERIASVLEDSRDDHY